MRGAAGYDRGRSHNPEQEVDMLSTSRSSRRKYLVSGVVALAVGGLAVTSVMDPGGGGFLFVGLLLVPGLIGGAIAMAIRLTRGRPVPSSRLRRDSFRNGPADVINFSRIRVAGLGGLGLIVVAVAMAFVLTRVGETLALGVAGGVLAAVLVILYRRRQGPLSMNEPGGRAFLVGGDDDEEPTPGVPSRPRRPPTRPIETAAAVVLTRTR
jgi:hypothetical protein